MRNKNTRSFDEKVFLAYFHELSQFYKSSSLWSKISMIKTMLKIEKNIDISNYAKVRAYLKKQHTGHVSKKSRVFTNDDIKNFMDNAPDSSYLPMKIALILGVHGACRREELHKLVTEDIQILDTVAVIKLRETKTHITRTFTIEGKYLEKLKYYIQSRPSKIITNKVFIRYENGKFRNLNIGINYIGEMPKNIATWLHLSEPESFTGHAFRRSSATILADSGANSTTLKRLGGWKSTNTAESYVEDSINNKRKIGKQITDAIESGEHSVPNKKKNHAAMIIAKNDLEKKNQFEEKENFNYVIMLYLFIFLITFAFKWYRVSFVKLFDDYIEAIFIQN